MFLPSMTFLSDKYTYEDYLKLNFRLDSPDDIWEKAIDIFKSRVESRFFCAIDKLMGNKDAYEMLKYGFAIMTLQCSLIDTFAKFRYGSNRQTERFKEFTKEYLIKDRNKNKEYLSKRFYEEIRCGLVHSGATENMSGLSCHLPNLITILDNGAISVDIFVMDKELRKYYNMYIKKLHDKKEENLRKNFVKTMDRGCKMKKVK